MNGLAQIAPISDLPRRYLELLSQSSRTNEPVILFRRNRPVGGLVDYALLQKFLEYKRQLELQDALQTIKEGKEAYQKGQTKILRNPADLWKPWKKGKK